MKTRMLVAVLAAGLVSLLLTGCAARPESGAVGAEQEKQTAESGVAADMTPQTDPEAESAVLNENAVVEAEEEYSVLTSEQVGAVLRVPAGYADEAVTESAFTLYVPTSDQTIDFDSAVYFFFDTSQTAYARDGLVWAITACPIEGLGNVLKADKEYSDLCFDLNCHILGVDSDSVYMLANINPASSTVRQFDSDSEESFSSYYAHAEAGMEILEDFVAANQLEVPDGAVDWKAWYGQWMLEPIKQQLEAE